MKFKEHIKSPLGITFSAIGLVVISIWSINGFFSWRSYAKFAYEAQRIQPNNLIELLNIEDEPDKIATFTKIENCNLVEIEMRNKSKYLLTYGGGSMTEVMNIVGRKGGKGIYKKPNTLLGLPLCFSSTSLQYQIYKSMRDGETAPKQNENNKNNQEQTQNNNSNPLPNLFRQKEQKRIVVMETANREVTSLGYSVAIPNGYNLCKEHFTAISPREFDAILANGGRVVGSPSDIRENSMYVTLKNSSGWTLGCQMRDYIIEQ